MTSTRKTNPACRSRSFTLPRPAPFRPARRRSRGAGGPSLSPSEVDVLEDVEVENGHHDEHQEDEPCLQEPLLHLEREVPPRNGLEERDEDLAAVEERNRKQVQEPELKRQDAHQAEERRGARARRLTREFCDVDRPRELAEGALQRDEPTENGGGRARLFAQLLERGLERGEKRQRTTHRVVEGGAEPDLP